MANLGYVSTFNINGNELSLKDAALTEIVEEIVEAIGANNGDISDRINNLHERSFDALIKISSQNESEIASIQDGIYKLQYVTVTGEGNNTVETLNNSAILIQKGTNQYLYKDGQISSRAKTNNTWGSWIIYDALLKSGGQMTGPITFGTGMVDNAALVLNTKPIIMDNGTYSDSTYRYALNFNNSGIEFGNYKMHTRLLSWNNPGDIIHMISSNNTSGGTIASYKMLDERNSGFTHYYNYTLNDEVSTGTVLPNDAIINYEYNQIKLGSNSQNLLGIGNLHPQLSMPLNSTQLTLNIGGETSTVTIQNAIAAASFTGSHYYTLDQTNSNKLVQIIGAKEGTNNLILGTGLTAKKVAQEGKTIGANPNTYNIELSSNIPTISTTVIENDDNPVSGGAVYNKFADLIGAAPAALDTLAEIADALNNDTDLAGTLTTQISSKVPKVSNPTTDNFASFNSDGTIKDSGHSHSDYITSIKTVNNESLVGTGNIVISGLPLVSATDNGKILMVVNDQWQLISPSVLYSGSGVPNNANGNNGDIYIQV